VSGVTRLGLLVVAVLATGCLYPSLRTVTETADAAGGAIAWDGSTAGADGNSGVPDALGVQPDAPLGGSGGGVGTGGVVGTGGARLSDFSLSSQHRDYARSYGVLELKLGPDRYEFGFKTVDGEVRDRGSATCRRPALAAAAR